MPTIILLRINAVFYYYYYYFQSLLLTDSEYTYRQTMGHRRGGMLICTGLGWVSSHVSTNDAPKPKPTRHCLDKSYKIVRVRSYELPTL